MFSILLALSLINLNDEAIIEPASILINGRPVPTNVSRLSDNMFLLTAGARKAKIKLSRKNNTHIYSIDENEIHSVSFRVVGGWKSVRYSRNNDDEVIQLGVGNVTSRLNDALLHLEKNKLIQFSGPELIVFGGNSHGAVIAHFSKFSRDLQAIETEYKHVPQPPQLRQDDREVYHFTRELIQFSPQTKSPFDISNDNSLIIPVELKNQNEWQRWATLSAISGKDLSLKKGLTSVEQLNSMRLMLEPKIQPWMMDLQPPKKLPEVYVAHVQTQREQYALLAIFNMTQHPKTQIFSFGELGLNPDVSYAIFDVWNARFFGPVAGKIGSTLQPWTCKLFIMRRATESPQVIQSITNLTGEAVFNVTASWDDKTHTLNGSVILDNNQIVNLAISKAYKDKVFEKAQAFSDDAQVSVHPARGFLRLEIRATQSGKANWSVKFEDLQNKQAVPASTLSMGADLPWFANFSRLRVEERVAGHYLFRNDALVCFFGDMDFIDSEVEPGSAYTFTSVASDYFGNLGEPHRVLVYTPRPIDTLVWGTPIVKRTPYGLPPALGLNSLGKPIVVNEISTFGMGVDVPSEIEFRIFRVFEKLSGEVALDDGASDETRVEFSIFGDGQKLWSSGEMKKTEKEKYELDVSEVYLLTFKSELKSGEGTMTGAVWINPLLKAKPHR